MIRSVIDGLAPKHEDIIRWSICLEDGTLRLIGRNAHTLEARKVISIYRTGKAYRHHNVGLSGLDVDSEGRIKEYRTPQEAHAHR